MTQVIPLFTKLFRAAHRPDVAQTPEPLPVIRWTVWRKVLLVVMLATALYFLLSVTYPSVWMITKAWGMHSQSVSELPRWLMATGATARNLGLIALALVVLAGLWAIAGRQATGLFRPATTHALGLTFYIRTGYPWFLATIAIYQLALRPLLPAQATPNTDGLPVSNLAEVAYWLTYGLAAGICEEIIATVLVYWLLEQVRTTSGKSLAMSGWGTAIIVATHLVYHTYYGAMVLVVIPSVYFSVICWRYTRSLWAIVIGHALWDIMMHLPPGETGRRIAMTIVTGLSFGVYYRLKASTQAKLAKLA